MIETGEFYEQESTRKLHWLEVISIGRTIIIWSPMLLKNILKSSSSGFVSGKEDRPASRFKTEPELSMMEAIQCHHRLQVHTMHGSLGKGRGCRQAMAETYKLSLPCPHGNVFLFWGTSLVGLSTTHKCLYLLLHSHHGGCSQISFSLKILSPVCRSMDSTCLAYAE